MDLKDIVDHIAGKYAWEEVEQIGANSVRVHSVYPGFFSGSHIVWLLEIERMIQEELSAIAGLWEVSVTSLYTSNEVEVIYSFVRTETCTNQD
jgi:hypothetical protein